MTYTYVNTDGVYGGNILLEPDRPVTQMELYNTLAELNSRVSASLDVPDWAGQTVMALLVLAAIVSVCIIVLAVCVFICTVQRRREARIGTPDLPHVLEGDWDDLLGGTCTNLIVKPERGFQCSACGAYSDTGDVEVEGQSYTVEGPGISTPIEYDNRQLFAFCPNCGREIVDDDCQ